MNRKLGALGALVLLSACVPTLEDTTSRVDGPRVLGVRATPAESLPNGAVHLDVLYADVTGAIAIAPIETTFCRARKPLSELGPVAPTCYDPSSIDQIVLGTGISVDGIVPRDACQLFGPNPPPPSAGDPAGRPVDADATGGYYLPSIVFRTDTAGTQPALAKVRVSCGVANAPSGVASEFAARYHFNANPTLLGLTLDDGSGSVVVPTVGAGAPPLVGPSAALTLTVAWPPCPDASPCGDGFCSVDETRTSCAADCTTPRGCGGAEQYVAFDPSTQSLVVRREAVRVSWFATAGRLEQPETGRSGDDLATTASNRFEAPAEAGPVFVFVVLRDERAGADFATFRFDVAP